MLSSSKKLSIQVLGPGIIIMSHTIISIVTPVYNQCEFIAETIESVLSQDIQGLEYLVVDDGSTDEIDEAVKPYLSKIRYIKKSNGGQSNALNFAWKQCQGEYIGYISADDRFNKVGALRELMEFSRAVGADIVYPNYRLINATGDPIRDIKVKNFKRNDLTILLQCSIGPGAIFKKNIFDEIGGWNPSLHQCPDFDFWFRAAKKGYSFCRLDSMGADYRVHGGSAMVRAVSKERANEILQVVDLDKSVSLTNKDKRKQYSNALLISSRLHGQAGRFTICIWWYLRALFYSPVTALSPAGLRMFLAGLFRITILKLKGVLR